MCAERTHRFLMAFVIATGTYLLSQANPYGQYILWFVVGMLVVYGITNFCPSVWMMKLAGLKSCLVKQSANKTED